MGVVLLGPTNISSFDPAHMQKIYLTFIEWTQQYRHPYLCSKSTLIFLRGNVSLTICECVEWFASDVQGSEGRALGLSGPPAGKGSLQGRRPVTDHPKGLPLHWDDLTSLRLRGVGVRLGN